MSDDQKLYSTKQAAKFLGVNCKTIQRYRKAGILLPDKFGANNSVFYSEMALVQACVDTLHRWATEKCDTSTRKCYTDPERVQTAQSVTSTAQNGQEKVGNRWPVSQALVQRLLKGGSTTEVSTANEKNSSSVEVKLQEVEEYYFDNDDDIVIINDSFKANLPAEYRQNLTKLFHKLQEAPLLEIFATPFNNTKTLITYAKLDYVNSWITFNGKFNKTYEVIFNPLYLFYRAENILFTSRNILQHIFGNVSDHFQSELVEVIEQHLDELRCMRISMDLKDKFGNNAFIKLYEEKYRPIALNEDILDVNILEMKSAKNSKVVKVYRINRLSPIFKYAEKLKQITSWQTEYMKVPVRKTMQNALLCNHLLTKISLVKNIRDNIRKMFDYWVKIKLVKSYRFEKKELHFIKFPSLSLLATLREASQID